MTALKIRNLQKTYKNQFQALKGIDLDVEKGDFFALLGPNGAGKSTTIGVITSLVNKTSGSVSVFGHDIDSELEQAKACIGLVPQELNFSQFETPLEIVVNQAGYYGIQRNLALPIAEKYLTQLGLWEKRNDISRTLSGGMKRRLMIARALMHEPKLLILDEPTAGVDIELRRSMWDFLIEINRQGTTIILTTHYLEEAENLCRHIAIIDQGQIVENQPMKKLLAQIHKQSFILDLASPLQQVPAINGYDLQLVDETCLQVDVAAGISLNNLFCRLQDQGIQVQSMKNKSNRLEELFLNLVSNDKQQTTA
jgi:ABC-2 type transport system ATP-binding protein